MRKHTNRSARAALAAAVLLSALLPSLSLAGEPADPWREVLSAKPEGPRAAMAAIESQIRKADAAALREIEGKLLDLLRAPAASAECREWACRQLRFAGSPRSVPALAALLADRDLGTVARLALQGIPGPEVDAALREALPKGGESRAGTVITIGTREDRGAVPLIAPLAGDRDPAVAEAALFALGRIGGDEALRALRAAATPEGLRRYRLQMILLCAERLAGEGGTAAAGEVYRSVLSEAADDAVRIPALRGLVACERWKAEPEVMAALRDGSPGLRAAAAALAARAGSPEILSAALDHLDSMPRGARVILLGLVEDRWALPAIRRAARSGANPVRAAALAAIGRLGDASCVVQLLGAASGEPEMVRAAARKGLRDLRGKDIEGALFEVAWGYGTTAGRIEAMAALADRGAEGLEAALLGIAGDRDPAIRAGALTALSRAGGVGAIPALVGKLVEANATGRGAIEEALKTICSRASDRDAAAEPVIAALPSAGPEVRRALLRVLAAASGTTALAAVRGVLAEADPEVRDEALRAIAGWTDPSAIADLAAAARALDPDRRPPVLAAVARLAGAAGGPAPEAKAKVLAEALALAGRTEERKALLAALAGVPHPDALAPALAALKDADLEVDAASAVVKIAAAIRKTHSEKADEALQTVIDACKSPTARQLAESSQFVPKGLLNIASQGTASSPDGFEKDGEASGDQAAIDGDPGTYWDEEDGKPLYRLKVDLRAPRKVVAIGIMGWAHHNYAPKDFEILCDGVPVKKVESAQYASNLLVVRFDGVNCTSVELKITGYYGNSPAIRELGIYRPAGAAK
jgi:HEAT repeat protein